MNRDRTAAAHFQLYAENEWSQVHWRLLSANNRTLGRSAAPSQDVESALLAIKGLPDLVVDSDAELRPTEENRWRWSLITDGVVVARSGHDYDRKVRCVSAVDGFINVLPRASVIDGVVFTPRRRSIPAPVVPVGGRYPARPLTGR